MLSEYQIYEIFSEGDKYMQSYLDGIVSKHDSDIMLSLYENRLASSAAVYNDETNEVDCIVIFLNGERAISKGAPNFRCVIHLSDGERRPEWNMIDVDGYKLAKIIEGLPERLRYRIKNVFESRCPEVRAITVD